MANVLHGLVGMLYGMISIELRLGDLRRAASLWDIFMKPSFA
jgi:hypothetical protein